jgi:hypothetical protein
VGELDDPVVVPFSRGIPGSRERIRSVDAGSGA